MCFRNAYSQAISANHPIFAFANPTKRNGHRPPAKNAKDDRSGAIIDGCDPPPQCVLAKNHHVDTFAVSQLSLPYQLVSEASNSAQFPREFCIELFTGAGFWREAAKFVCGCAVAVENLPRKSSIM